jgi:hypothetical protein
MPNPTGTQQTILTPSITQVEGTPVPAKMQAVQCNMGTSPTFQWTFVDPIGNPLDVNDLVAAGYTPQLRLLESLSQSGSASPTVIAATFVNPPIVTVPLNLVQAQIPLAYTQFPGISLAEWSMINLTTGAVAFTNMAFLVVNNGLYANGVTVQGTPMIPEIRLWLRDSDPAGNLWLGTFEWDLAEIAACIARPIMYFNEAPPPIDQQYNTANFPWRSHWLDAICGYLMRMSADWYRRVHLPYQAGGLTIDDKNKFQQYDARGQELIKKWEEWVQWKKVELNANAAYQTIGSSYSNFGWY